MIPSLRCVSRDHEILVLQPTKLKDYRRDDMEIARGDIKLIADNNPHQQCSFLYPLRHTTTRSIVLFKWILELYSQGEVSLFSYYMVNISCRVYSLDISKLFYTTSAFNWQFLVFFNYELGVILLLKRKKKTLKTG